jgi:hypothetical protein
VTSAAVRRLVLAFKHIPRQIVIKVILIETYHFKIPSMVFAVALKTVLFNDLGTYMIALISVYARLDLRMTGKAFGIGNFPSDVMTLRTVTHPFQVGMRIG